MFLDPPFCIVFHVTEIQVSYRFGSAGIVSKTLYNIESLIICGLEIGKKKKKTFRDRPSKKSNSDSKMNKI